MTNNIYWVFKLEIGEGNMDALKQLATRFSQNTTSEVGALAYEWSVTADGKTLHVYERYADSEAALVHLGNVGPHLGELFALTTPVVIECYGQASDAFKEAVKGLPVVYLDQIAGFSK